MKIKEILKTFDDCFEDSWLIESPQRIQRGDMFEILLFDIRDCKSNDFMKEKIIDLGNYWFKYDGFQNVLYWYEKDNEIFIGGQFRL